MKVCIWFSCHAESWSPPGNQLLFDPTIEPGYGPGKRMYDRALLAGMGPSQTTPEMVVEYANLCNAETASGLHLEPCYEAFGILHTEKCWVYDDTANGSPDGFVAVFVELHSLEEGSRRLG